MTKERRTFTREFKVEAVRLLNESGKSMKQISADLGVPRNSLNRWRSELAGDVKEAFRGNGKRTAEQDRMWRLEREVEFPRPMSLLMRTMRLVPNALYDRILRPYAKRRIDPEKVRR